MKGKTRAQASKKSSKAKAESPALRKVSKAELARTLEKHKQWLNTRDKKVKKGKQADLSYTNLRQAHLRNADLKGADLRGARLREANLRHANLQQADLRDANLQRAKLHWADLEGARLRDANLRGAKLRGANLQRAHLRYITGLQEADLQDANLESATGLLGAEFAGNDITGTTLPKDIHEFKVLQVIEETSKNARKIFIWVLLACVYSWLTIATTTDARLLTNSASSALPIIGTEIPIAWFYMAAPIILLALYVYLHFYLQRLWEGLAYLPAIFPDGKRLDQRAYPWLLNGLVRRHFTLLRKDRTSLVKLEELVTIALAWWTVPATLIAFWLRYLPRHDWWGTGLHVVLLAASIAAAISLYGTAAKTLRGERHPSASNWVPALLPLLAVGITLLSMSAIHNPRWFARYFHYDTFANFREADVSTKPANWRGRDEDIVLVRGAQLRGTDLRYADAVRAFLVNADLRFANLQDAYFASADLRRAFLLGVDLRGANLDSANLRGAIMGGVKLKGANLSRADLRWAKGLDQKELNKACGDAATELPSGLSVEPCR